jgi:hypothetical protein
MVSMMGYEFSRAIRQYLERTVGGDLTAQVNAAYVLMESAVDDAFGKEFMVRADEWTLRELSKFFKVIDLENETGVLEFVRAFTGRWKDVLKSIHEDVIRAFADFKCGAEVLKRCYTQLLMWYARAAATVQNSTNEELKAFRREMVGQQVVLYECRKYAQDFEQT